MRIHIAAVGRMRSGPEKDLVDDYLARFAKSGRGLGLSFGGVLEVEDRKAGGAAAEAGLLRNAIPDGAATWVLDERGDVLTSPDFAAAVSRERDGGRRALALVIGGADGIEPSFRASADRAISLGAMVWPHMLVRVMLSEQLYRAASILQGTPYHRA
ncbi:MAG: 23S rRNA (pseudouridine(1915)-N(3))-methyltransferase RlmH [Roseicyclus sp.]